MGQMKAYKNLSPELTNTYKKVYLYYGKEFPKIGVGNNIFCAELVANNWAQTYQGQTFIYDFRRNLNIFEDDFIEWIENDVYE